MISERVRTLSTYATIIILTAHMIPDSKNTALGYDTMVASNKMLYPTEPINGINDSREQIKQKSFPVKHAELCKCITEIRFELENVVLKDIRYLHVLKWHRWLIYENKMRWHRRINKILLRRTIKGLRKDTSKIGIQLKSIRKYILPTCVFRCDALRHKCSNN